MLSEALNISSSGTVISDDRGIIRWANKRAAELLGSTEEELAGAPAGNFGLAPSSENESSIIGSDGSRIIFTKDFRTIDTYGTPWQLSTLKIISKAPAYYADRGKDIINTPIINEPAAINVWSVDTGYRYTFFNENHRTAMKQIWDADIRIGSYILDYLEDPLYIDQVKANYLKILGGESHRSLDHFKTLAGEEKYLENFGHPIRDADENITGIMLYTVDVTKKTEIENRLKLTVSLLESIINSPEEIQIFSIDNEYRYIFFNNAHIIAMERFWSAKPETERNILGLLPDSEKKREIKKYFDESFLRLPEPKISELRDGSGQTFYISMISAPIHDSDGNVSGITIFSQDITKQFEAEREVKESLKQKEFLLKEIHHRVKNNIQQITSMLNLQLGAVEDEKARHMLKDSISRIDTMGLIHETLYKNADLQRISMNEYCRNLTDTIMKLYSHDRLTVKIEHEIDEIFLEMNRAIPVGLIINELFTNSMKYAFGSRPDGLIKLKMSTENGLIHLRVMDNGAGFHQKRGPESSETLGMQLLDIFTEQLGGSISFESHEGLTVDISFPE